MNLLDLIFPIKCLECGSSGKYLCDNCLDKVEKSGWFGRNYAVYKYQGVVRRAIISLKYKYSTEIAKELAQVVSENLKILNLISNNHVLVPIPLHWQRKNARGFNQSEVVGKLVANQMGWKFEPNLLIKNIASKPQVGLKGEARRKNLKKVFSVSSNHLISNNYSLVIFDDVMTTGSTLKEASEVLKNAGFKNIWSLTVAR